MTNASAGGGGSPFSSQMASPLDAMGVTAAAVQPLTLTAADGSSYAVTAGDLALLASSSAAAPAAAPQATIAIIAGAAAAGLIVTVALATVLAMRRRRRARAAHATPFATTVTDDDGKIQSTLSPLQRQSLRAASSSNVQRSLPDHGRRHEGAAAVAVAGTWAATPLSDAAPPGWTEEWSRSHNCPYWRAADGTTTWERPSVAARTTGAGGAAANAAAAELSSGGELPPGWTEHWSRSRNHPYWCAADGTTTWERPTASAAAEDAAAAVPDTVGELPPGWTEQWSRSRNLPYWRADDGTTSWTRPTGVADVM